MRALGIAATGMLAQQTNVDVISNNIANANTTGYKSGRAAFEDLIYQTEHREGAQTSDAGTTRPVGVDIGLGVQSTGVVRLNTQGGLTKTGNDLDLAIDGQGYFTVNMPDGSQAYTRAGNFQISATGQIVTLEGYEVSPGINIPANTTKIEINQQGLVQAFVGTSPTPVDLGQFTMASFVNEAGMKPIGNNLLQATVASGDATTANPGDPGIGVLRQGYLESSNVNVIQQITDLISAQRAYEMNSKAVQTADQMMNSTNQMK